MTDNVRQFRKRKLYGCLRCGAVLGPQKDMLYLTSYPVNEVYQCTVCGTVHYMLADNVLCTEQEFDRRIYRSYAAG